MLGLNAKTNSGGFTIIELLIVVVVIAILSTITILSYNGVTQKASTAVLNNSALQWGKLIQAEYIKTGVIGVTSNSCLGKAATDFPASNGFSAGACVIAKPTSGGADIVISYNPAAFTNWSSSQSRPDGSLPISTMTVDGYSYKARGIWIHSVIPAVQSVQLAWIPQVTGQCGAGLVAANGTGSGPYDGGLCIYQVNY